MSYQPVTLERHHLSEPDLGKITIREDYTVTDKADGERMLLFVAGDNNMYTIDSRLHIRNMNSKHPQKNSLLDGEYIRQSKYNSDYNTFMIFDVYFINGKDVRNKKLVPERVKLMDDFSSKTSSTFRVKPKKFLFGNDILKLAQKAYEVNKYDYHIDGIIFTPALLSVGGYYKNEDSDTDTFGGTWMNVLKWKPPEENSIDMLVSFESDAFVPGHGKCKLCKLQVSYKTTSDITVNPYDVLSKVKSAGKAKFVPKTFASVYLQLPTNQRYPRSTKNEIIYNNTIVEFTYDFDKDERFCWIPYRVREDKTELFVKTRSIVGTANSYNTAMSVWRTINNPVTLKMITGAEDVPITESNQYYSRNVSRTKILSKPMLTFHNKCVKSKLFRLFKNEKATLIDLACGKGGDLFKWIENKYSFVVGVEINLDNLLNVDDGAYKRLQQLQNKHNLDCVFLQKDLSTPWTDTSVMTDTNLISLYQTLWGNLSKKEVEVKSMLKYHNIMTDKFDVVSCQFAIHYMFENDDTLNTFCDNVNKVIKRGGYFIGTCLDGEKVADVLVQEESITGVHNENVLWQIKKKYTNENILGRKISVYLESINAVHDEYLVDMNLLVKKLADRGIRQLNDTDLKKLKLETSYGSFRNWHNEQLYPMFDTLKTFSFLNTWFVFKKYE